MTSMFTTAGNKHHLEFLFLLVYNTGNSFIMQIVTSERIAPFF